MLVHTPKGGVASLPGQARHLRGYRFGMDETTYDRLIWELTGWDAD